MDGDRDQFSDIEYRSRALDQAQRKDSFHSETDEETIARADKYAKFILNGETN